MNQNLRGTGVALVTPFDKEGQVDYAALKKLIQHTVKGGVNILVVLGTTGETPTLTKEEKQEILSFVRKEVHEEIILVAGFGGNNTMAICDDLKSYNLEGYHYILSASPYYNKPSQEGIYQHYKMIAKASPLPVILYNVPGRTSSNIAPETVIKIARDMENVVAIKEASGNIDQCMRIVKNKPKDFVVLSGDDNLVVAQMAIGLEGCISVIANLLPKEFSTMINLALENKFSEAKDIQLNLLELIDALFEEGNPVGVKTALNLSNICLDSVRLPLVKGSEQLKEKIKKLLIQIK